jgi:hypothetical protein
MLVILLLVIEEKLITVPNLPEGVIEKPGIHMKVGVPTHPSFSRRPDPDEISGCTVSPRSGFSSTNGLQHGNDGWIANQNYRCPQSIRPRK